MTRSFTASSLVTLPRLTAVSTARLMQELLNAAKAERKLPASIATDRDEVAEAYQVLQAELAKRLAAESEDGPVVRAADMVEDNAFGALSDWLSAWARLPGDRHPESADAAAVLQAIFPSGLTFLTIRPSDEWQEAEVRMRLIADKGHDDAIARLGGKPFLDELRIAHKAYGEALGITAVKQASETPALREARDTATDVVRAYVLRVSANVRKKDPESAALAQRLLAPLVNWKDRPARVSASSEPSAPAAPVAPAPVSPSAPTGLIRE
jgi:hypothetical protein